MTEEPLTVWVARCCRVWLVVLGYPIRRCKLCGNVPVLTSENPKDFEP